MRAGWRFGIAAIAAAAIFGSAPARAQDNAAATNTTASPPPAETVGPRELRDFSLPGTVTRPAPPPAERAPAPATASPPPRTAPSATRPATTAPVQRERTTAAPAQEAARRPPSGTSADPLAGFEIDGPVAPASPVAASPELEPAPLSPPAGAAEPQSPFSPWMIALLLIGAGAAFYFWRQRAQPSYAAASAAQQPFAAAEPEPRPQPLQRAPAPRPEPAARPTTRPEPTAAPTPVPQPVPRPAPMPPVRSTSPAGLVTTSLRPWLEIEFIPGRCVVENDKATIQFDVSVFNSGSAPARDVLIEASMFNAGPAQDQEIGAFFSHPATAGDRIPAIPPLKRIALKKNVSLSREQLRQYEVGGRKLFVPMVGLNALYRWGGGEGQTSASYVVGRDTEGEKMAPLRLDLGPRIFRGLGARQHNVAVRN